MCNLLLRILRGCRRWDGGSSQRDGCGRTVRLSGEYTCREMRTHAICVHGVGFHVDTEMTTAIKTVLEPGSIDVELQDFLWAQYSGEATSSPSIWLRRTTLEQTSRF